MRYIPTVVVAFSCDFVVANPILIKKTSIQWNIELYKTRHNEFKFEKKVQFSAGYCIQCLPSEASQHFWKYFQYQSAKGSLD